MAFSKNYVTPKSLAHLQSRYDKILAECIKNVEALGYHPEGEIIHSVRVTNNIRRVGTCRKEWIGNYFNGHYQHKISCTAKIADNDENIRNVLYHEIIHTIPGCFNHGKKFKNVMDEINKTYHANVGTVYQHGTSDQKKKTNKNIKKATNNDVESFIGSNIKMPKSNKIGIFTGFRPRARKYTCTLQDSTGDIWDVTPNYIIKNVIKPI